MIFARSPYDPPGEPLLPDPQEDDDRPLCQQCQGSGEGHVDGSRCTHCRGKGLEPDREAERDAWAMREERSWFGGDPAGDPDDDDHGNNEGRTTWYPPVDDEPDGDEPEE